MIGYGWYHIGSGLIKPRTTQPNQPTNQPTNQPKQPTNQNNQPTQQPKQPTNQNNQPTQQPTNAIIAIKTTYRQQYKHVIRRLIGGICKDRAYFF